MSSRSLRVASTAAIIAAASSALFFLQTSERRNVEPSEVIARLAAEPLQDSEQILETSETLASLVKRLLGGSYWRTLSPSPLLTGSSHINYAPPSPGRRGSINIVVNARGRQHCIQKEQLTDTVSRVGIVLSAVWKLHPNAALQEYHSQYSTLSGLRKFNATFSNNCLAQITIQEK
jgi:hypothetical protein